MPSWHLPPSDPFYRTSEDEAPTHMVPKRTDILLLLAAVAIFVLAAIAGQRNRDDNVPPTTPASATTFKGTDK